MNYLYTNYRSVLTFLFKILFAFFLLNWLISQNKLDTKLVLLTFNNPLHLIFCLSLLLFHVFLSALRWNILLKTKKILIPFREVLKIQWIGQFFSIVLPGGVTGDLIKIGYISSIQKSYSKKTLLLSIFIDRLAGLYSLLVIAGISSYIFYDNLITYNPLLKSVIFINAALLIFSSFALIFFFLNLKHQLKIKSVFKSKKMDTLLDSIWDYSLHKKEMFYCLLLSPLIHFLVIGAFWVINFPFFEKPIELKQLLSIIPLGQVVTALPISPAGLGVGHFAFERLFHFIGHSNGASLFNVFWILVFSVDLLGVIPFIFSKNRKEKII